jgi:Na+/proline symporter
LSQTTVMSVALIVYMVVMYALAFKVQGRNQTAADFLVAGRRLPLTLAWFTLLATWYGGETLLNVSDEVAHSGMQATLKDPLGAGLCLLLAGWLVAVPLWKTGSLTVSDYFAMRFGERAGKLSAMLLVPTYFGWVAAQFALLSPFIEQAAGLPAGWGMPLVAVLGTGYTLMGGMWSVALTDAVQLILLVLGLFVMLGCAVWQAGLLPWRNVQAEAWSLVPQGGAIGWLASAELLAIGALGNLPGQDLLQRTLSTRSAAHARWACYLAGLGYLTLGFIPVLLAIASRPLGVDPAVGNVIGQLSDLLLSPPLQVIFVLAVVSCVLSTIDSALLAPAGLLAQNLLPVRLAQRHGEVRLNQYCVLVMAAGSLGLAYTGRGAFELLQDAYSLPMATLLVPLLGGLYVERAGDRSGLAAMLVGLVVWLVFWIPEELGYPMAPGALIALLASATGFLLFHNRPAPTRAGGSPTGG